MTLKALATQLECQGVDPGYIQRFDWEDWILTLPSDSRMIHQLSELVSNRMRSLVLHLLQEYLKVTNAEYIKTLQETLEELRRDLEDYKDVREELKQSRHELETLKGTLRSLDLT